MRLQCTVYVVVLVCFVYNTGSARVSSFTELLLKCTLDMHFLKRWNWVRAYRAWGRPFARFIHEKFVRSTRKQFVANIFIIMAGEGGARTILYYFDIESYEPVRHGGRENECSKIQERRSSHWLYNLLFYRYSLRYWFNWFFSKASIRSEAG